MLKMKVPGERKRSQRSFMGVVRAYMLAVGVTQKKQRTGGGGKG